MDGHTDGQIDIKGLEISSMGGGSGLLTAPAASNNNQSILTAALASVSASLESFSQPIPEGVDKGEYNRTLLALWDNLSLLLPAQQLAEAGGDGQPSQPIVITHEAIQGAIDSGQLSEPDKAALSALLNSPDMQAAVGADAAAQIDFNNLHTRVSDYNRANFTGILMAASAVNSGIPVNNGSNEFITDMSAEFCNESVFDAAVVKKSYDRLISDTNINQLISAQIKLELPGADAAALSLFDRVTGPYYSGALEYIESTPGGADAASARVNQDLSTLNLLDPELGREAAAVLIQRRLISTIDKATPATAGNSAVTLASQDIVSLITTILKGGRGAVRLPGLLAGHDAGWGQIATALGDLSKWSAERLGALGNTLSAALQMAGTSTEPSAEAVIAAAASAAAEAALAAATDPASQTAARAALEAVRNRAADLKQVVGKLEAKGLWATTAGAVSIASGIYKIAGTDMASDAWGRLSIANDFVLSTCFTPGYASAANSIATKLGKGWTPESIGMAPTQTFSKLLQGVFTNNMSELTVAGVVPTRLGAAIGTALKGLTGFSLIAAGTISGVFGVKQIVDSANNGDAASIAEGSLGIGTGVAWGAAGIGALVGSALVGPLIAVGVIFGIAAFFISLFGHPPHDKFADAIHDRLGDFADSGALKDGWDGALKDWFDRNRNIPLDSGIGMDL